MVIGYLNGMGLRHAGSMVMLIAISLALISCSSHGLTGRAISDGSANVSDAKPPIKIGGIFGLTGYSSEWGQADFMGATLAVEESNSKGGINGSRIDLVVEDDRSDYTSTSTAVTKLAQVDGVKVILGPTWGEFAAVAIPFAEREDVVLVSPSGGGKDKVFDSSHFFTLWPHGGFEVTNLCAFLSKKNLTRVSIAHSQDSWSEGVKDMFMEEASTRNVNVLDTFESMPGQADFKTIILRLLADKPDAIFIPFSSERDKGMFLKEAHELGLNSTFFAMVSTQSDELVTTFAPYGEGIIYTYPAETESGKEFDRKFETRFGKKPNAPNARNAFDAATAVIKALESQPGSTKELISALLKTDFDGASGRIQFDEHGKLRNMNFSIKTLLNGKYVEFPE